MSNENQPGAVRFWLSHAGTQERIRVEWSTNDGLATNEASFDGERLHWSYGKPPEFVQRIARTAIEERAERNIDGGEFAGWESWREMDAAADAPQYDAWFRSQNPEIRCVTCRDLQPSLTWLSKAGECGRCFARTMAVAS